MLYLLRERLTQPPSVAGEAIEWKEIRLVGASERLGCFVRRQYEPVRSRAAVCVARENVNGRQEEVLVGTTRGGVGTRIDQLLDDARGDRFRSG